MSIPERRMVVNYIIYRDWEIGNELATNAIAYRRLRESNELDSSKGSHVLLVNGKIKYYGEKISSEEYQALEKKYPGKYYIPIIERTVILRSISATEDAKKKEWQVRVYNSYTSRSLNE